MKPTFRSLDAATVAVFLEGRIVGRIKRTDTMRDSYPASNWQYTPTGSKTGGELFPTLAACKASLMPEYEVTK